MGRCNKLFRSIALDIIYSIVGTPWRYCPRIKIVSESKLSHLWLCLCHLCSWLYLMPAQWHPTPGLLPGKSHGRRSLVGCSPWGHEESDMTERLHFHALEKEIATHSSILAWRIPGTGEPRGLQSKGLVRVGHDQVTSYFHFPLSRIGEGNGNPLQYSCLGNPMDRGACWASVPRVTKEPDMT